MASRPAWRGTLRPDGHRGPGRSSSGGIAVRGFIVNTVITAIAFYVLTRFLHQFVSYNGELVGLLVLAVIFGLVNGLIGPVVKTLAFPLTLMTMGLIGFVINAGLLLVTALIA